MQQSQKIEKQWLKNFRKSIVVDPWTGVFRPHYAKQLYYGKNESGFPPDFPSDFESKFENRQNYTSRQLIDFCFTYLACIGIKIKEERFLTHWSSYPDDHNTLLWKSHYILKRLAHYEESLNVHYPYLDNVNDIRFLSRIASGESLTAGQLNLFEDIPIPDLHRRLNVLPENYENQPEIQNLFTAIENSNNCFFITGKAGTGKSTFIHYFAQKTRKKTLLTAFTGVAAINVHGQTLHSLFQFPFRPLLPGDNGIKVFTNQSEKRGLIETVQTIIIDEVSMLRSDILEAIDHSLRQNGGDPDKLFGGKQLLFIGDIFQLPPVVNNQEEVEKEIFGDIFESEYFFSSPAFKSVNASFYQFEISHRQKEDQKFVELLDKVRVCNVDTSTIEAINTRHIPDFTPEQNEFVVTLTTTNSKASLENTARLTELDYVEYPFEATVIGDFNVERFPTDKFLKLKRGAQVMFVKNDPSRKWVNGTIAKIEFITEESIEVRLQDGTIHKVIKERWENRKYKFDRATRSIKTEVTGTFEQYPLKLAWAITIHKSQGLTFDKVVIDFGSGAFVNGQVYTALSRCKTLEGIFLKNILRKEDIISDPRITNFHKEILRQNNTTNNGQKE